MAYDDDGNFIGLRDLNDGIGIDKNRALEIVNQTFEEYDKIAKGHGGGIVIQMAKHINRV